MIAADFIEIWKRCSTVQEVADATGYTPNSVVTLASRFRKKGYDVPKKNQDEHYFSRIGKMGGRPKKQEEGTE